MPVDADGNSLGTPSFDNAWRDGYDQSGTSTSTGSLVVGFAPPPTSSNGATMYRLTARGTGGTDTAVAVVQNVYRK